MTAPIVRRMTLTEDAIRAYSRRGNYHSDPDAARAEGLPGLVAQGMQVVGPAYAALLDAWGSDFLERGELDVRFVGVVLVDHEVAAEVSLVGDEAAIRVENTTAARTAVVGRARRQASSGRPDHSEAVGRPRDPGAPNAPTSADQP